jgi:hypothetical protein
MNLWVIEWQSIAKDISLKLQQLLYKQHNIAKIPQKQRFYAF